MSVDDKDKVEAPAPARVGDSGGHDSDNDGYYGVDVAPAQERIATTAARQSAVPADAPPLPYDEAPPLPDEAVPEQANDGWTTKWDNTYQAYYFVNARTGVSQWENPRVPEATVYPSGWYNSDPTSAAAAAVPSSSGAPGTSSPPKRKWGGYNPAIHGSYDPNADYAREALKEEEEEEQAAAAAAAAASAALLNANPYNYSAQANFNRFTGKFQQAEAGPEMHNDENKSKRQLTAFFDVDAAANSHDGRSLKEERRNKTLTRKELKAFKEKRHSKKEEKRLAWLRK